MMQTNHKVDRVARNQEIRNKYDHLVRVDGLQPRIAKNKLAEEYRLSYRTIEDILYKN